MATQSSTSPRRSRGNSIVTIVAALIGAAAVKQCFKSNGPSPATQGFSAAGSSSHLTDDILERAAREMRKSLPMKVDAETRFDTVEAGPGKKFAYFYTLSTLSSETHSEADFQRRMRPILIKAYKSEPSMKIFRENNVDLTYIYSDRNGKPFASILIKVTDLE